MAFSALSVQPGVCPISAAGGTSKHKLVNQSAVRLAFKIKCSDNSHYRVNPVFGFVEIGYTTEIEIIRVKGKPKADKLVVMWAQVDADTKDPMAPFLPNAKSPFTGETIVKLSAAE